jgi:hypothetical protein
VQRNVTASFESFGEADADLTAPFREPGLFLF